MKLSIAVLTSLVVCLANPKNMKCDKDYATKPGMSGAIPVTPGEDPPTSVVTCEAGDCEVKLTFQDGTADGGFISWVDGADGAELVGTGDSVTPVDACKTAVYLNSKPTGSVTIQVKGPTDKVYVGYANGFGPISTTEIELPSEDSADTNEDETEGEDSSDTKEDETEGPLDGDSSSTEAPATEGGVTKEPSAWEKAKQSAAAAAKCMSDEAKMVKCLSYVKGLAANIKDSATNGDVAQAAAVCSDSCQTDVVDILPNFVTACPTAASMLGDYTAKIEPYVKALHDLCLTNANGTACLPAMITYGKAAKAAAGAANATQACEVTKSFGCCAATVKEYASMFGADGASAPANPCGDSAEPVEACVEEEAVGDYSAAAALSTLFAVVSGVAALSL